MALYEGEDNELVVAIVKAAIGEAKVYFHSYEQKDHSMAGVESSIHVTVSGEVEGKLRLTGRAAQQCVRVFQMSKTSDALKAANKRADALSKKLAQLHALSDPET